MLLDEPCEGLAPVVVEQLGTAIAGLKSEMPIPTAERNARFALAISGRGYVIDKGLLRYGGTREDLLENQEVQSRYLSVGQSAMCLLMAPPLAHAGLLI